MIRIRARNMQLFYNKWTAGMNEIFDLLRSTTTGERSPDMESIGEIKYLGQTKTSTAALQLTEGSVKARGRKPRKQITWSSRLGVMQRASYPFMENSFKLKTLNELMELDGLMDTDESVYKGICVINYGRTTSNRAFAK